GVVTKVGKTWALVDIGSHRGLLPVKEFSWCHKEDSTRSFRYFVCKNLDDTLFPGDEIEVRVLNTKESWKKTLGVGWKGPTEFARLAMEQPPKPQAARVNMRVTDGAILTMVGGRDYRGSEFNRATQAKRQVGSTFKPFCYAAALDHPTAGFTPSTILLDAPIVEESRGTRGRLWRPNNAGNNFEGETTFRRGLMLSRNTITLKILQTMGVPYVAEYVERFGFESKIDANMSMCLGTSSISLVELAEAYTVFSTLGDLQSSYFISEVRDRHGSVLESRKAGDRTEDVMDAGTAYQMVRLMRDVVQAGTATKARALSSTLAGKTGTTDDFHDAWFVGYTPELVTISWVGLDEFVSMGKGQYGGDVALPIFIDYMGPALAKYPPSKYTQPENIVMMIVDSKTGLLVRKGQMGAWAAFKQGTGPSTYAPAPDEVDTASFLTGEF
ncbi:MAG: penicillin-binding transpeptidase domain-containing protein, partial [Myxococcota bacterium]|nr:penicillin-binding transpeptidase domain-containing protein [Myxococcota bacterium]